MRRPASAASSTAAALAVLLAGAPAHAATGSYVALGDSYSSGTGTRAYLDDGTTCQRSVYAYPSLVASSRGYALNFRACSGARAADVASLQLDALGAGTTHVSLTVGGNDAGFADVLTECAQPSWASDCGAAIDRAVSFIKTTLPGRLSSLYSSVRSRAPQARVVIGGYPRLFNGEDCNAFTWFSATEMTRLNATADLMNSRLKTAADAAGFAFSDPTSAFVGHAVCADVEWVNGLSSPTSESYHPNRPGHSSGYTPLVGGALTGSTVTASATTVSTAESSAGRLAEQQRRYAARDRAIRPERFLVPDLRSPRVRAAAARAGVDLSSRASIDAADRRDDAAQAGKAHLSAR